MATTPLQPDHTPIALSADTAALLKRTALAQLTPGQVNTTHLAIHPQILQAGHVFNLVDRQLVVKQDSALVFADLLPQANWGHPCIYRFHDPATAALLYEENAQFPPDIASTTKLEVFHAPVAALRATTLASIAQLGSLVQHPLVPITTTRSTQQRYAILFASQICNLRHVEDLEFLWRALVNVYGFDPANVYVLNYNGTIAATDSTNPGNWNGDNTAYQMKIHSSATTANLQAVFDTLKTKLAPKDLLLIHTNNHGSPSGLCVDSSTIITPDQFGTMISGLPKFQSLVVTMEQCYSGAFQTATTGKSTAVNTVFASAVDAKTSSDGASHFDPWALAWVEALVSAAPAGTALASKPCPNFDGYVSIKASTDWAKANDTGKDDNPQYADHPAGCGNSIYLGPPTTTQHSGDLNGDGRSEHVVTSPWGIGVLEEAGNTMSGLVCQPNGTRFGGWLLSTVDNQVGPIADLDGDGKAEVIITSPWGLGVLKLAGNTFAAPVMLQNGSKAGAWTLNTATDTFGPAADFDGDGHAELLVTGPSGMGILKMSGGTLTSIMVQPNEAFLGGWRLETNINNVVAAADFDGDGKAELLLTSPWGVGLLKLAGGSMTTVAIQPNGTRFGGWLLDTSNNHIGRAADYDGDHRAEVIVTSPWGIGVLKLAGNTFTACMLQPNGTRFGGWLMDTFHNKIGPAADFDGDGKAELMLSSPWGIGLLKLSGGTFACPMLQPNGTRFGGWLLNTVDNHFTATGRYSGTPAAQLLVTSPWGIGLLSEAGGTMSAPMLQPNGTRFGSWLLNTADNHF